MSGRPTSFLSSCLPLVKHDAKQLPVCIVSKGEVKSCLFQPAWLKNKKETKRISTSRSRTIKERAACQRIYSLVLPLSSLRSVNLGRQGTPRRKLPFPVASASPSIANQEIIQQTWKSARHKQPPLRVMNSLFVIYQMRFHLFSSYSHD